MLIERGIEYSEYYSRVALRERRTCERVSEGVEQSSGEAKGELRLLRDDSNHPVRGMNRDSQGLVREGNYWLESNLL